MVFNSLSLLFVITGFLFILISYLMRTKEKEQKLNEINHAIQQENSEDSQPIYEKMYAINEYSDFVLNEIEKKHKELLFMYQIINEKEKAIQEKSGQQQKLNNSSHMNVKAESKTEEDVEKVNLTKERTTNNHNKKILSLYKEGLTMKEIAKKLNLGIGEVKLVIDLFKEVLNE